MRRSTISLLAALLTITGAVSAFAGGLECRRAAAANRAQIASHEDEGPCGKSTAACLSAMAARIQSKGWLGIETQKDDHGRYRIAGIESHSPAQNAGFEFGDVLLTLNGLDLYAADKSALEVIKFGLAVGSRVSYTVQRRDHERILNATLSKVPEDIMARWIGEHMLDQHAHIEVASR